MKNLKKIIFNKLPEKVKAYIFLKSLVIPDSQGDIELKFAKAAEEFEQALHLLYKAYLDVGFVKEDESGVHITPFLGLPSTTTLIAKKGEKVIGTLTIVGRGALGLPADKIFDLKNFYENKSEVVEISSLAIDKEHRREKGGATFLLILKFMYEFCKNRLNCPDLIVIIHPNHAFFYKEILGFVDLNLPIADYMGVPAQALTLNLNDAFKYQKSKYDHLGADKNLFRFFTNP